ncbi:MAG: hypothetical protein MZV64_35255 [Ignavibacteriales bacterium]|nr:hypothetical protein [Ignavibacteriales bacterium]
MVLLDGQWDDWGAPTAEARQMQAVEAGAGSRGRALSLARLQPPPRP